MEWRDDKTGTHRAMALMHIAVACITTEELPHIISVYSSREITRIFGLRLSMLRPKKKEMKKFYMRHSDIFFDIREILSVSMSNLCLI